MEIKKTFLNGCFVLKPNVLVDSRGSFFESFNQRKFEKITGLKVTFVQDNQSTSFSIILNDDNKYQLFIPRGFAHGFITLSTSAIFSYKCDNYYHKNAESGIFYDDSLLNIDWKLNKSEIKLSDKDRELKHLKDLV